jgi:imidazolonepropionase-like amidohydrolase
MIQYLRPISLVAASMLGVLVHADQQAAPEPSASAPATLIRNIRIFDGRNEPWNGGEVLIIGDRIAQVSRTPISSAANTRVIDGGGRLLSPGFIDAHVHMNSVLTPDEMRNVEPAYATALTIKGAEASLLRGFTTQRDTGGNVFGLKQAIDAGVFPGPRVYPSGAAISQTSGHGDSRDLTDPPRFTPGAGLSLDERLGESVLADGVPAMLTAVREQLRHGASQIKLLASGGASTEFDPLYVSEFTSEELRAAVDAASSFGTYVTVHSYNPEATRRAIEAGVRCVEHGHLLDDATLKLMADRGIWLSTNVIVYEIPPAGITPVQRAKFEEVWTSTDRMMQAAKKLKVKIGFGTDLVYGLANQARQNREFTLRARWFTPLEILRQATSGNAELLALSGRRNPYPGKLGVIEPGAYADLLLIDGDPFSDVSTLEHPEKSLALIMKGGRIYKDSLTAAR